ncbi:hypothetical protein QNR57_003157 [Escherichia coli]|nr:hypothetical protein [Escherichia coli]HAW5285614.1 hypothetical protein [Escherichia coli]
MLPSLSPAVTSSCVHFCAPDRLFEPSDYRAWLRAETYLRLDILISELQKETASIHNLQGIDAVRILVSRHSALSIIEVRHLSFSELIFLLQPALESANIPPEVIQYPPHVDEQLQDVPYNQRAGLTPCSEAEWDHSLLKKYQDLYNPQ